ncbi:hypothetical protein VCSRO18_3389 [Vibrio cholerae]|jgi:hypothetical protein|uniref:HNH endonuclease n=1 Tax=Vibrio cholerae TaxID=666 RepID=UPI0016522723|nr:HNH endonuclease [Vibrio cholerae]EKF9139834.1 hypothetical protein [Vibrio cholerae]GIA39505.1 hypothetical protein VCSRO18_3389 [Vibrio cholerae]
MTCIICLGENEITDENPLTDEHIVPEFIGGTLVEKNVCKTCNSNLGGGFEGRLASNFYFKLARQVFDIKGKQPHAPNAFNGVYDHDSLGKVRVSNGKVAVFPEVQVEQNGSGFSISLKIDKSEQPQAAKILRKKLERHFKSQGVNLSSEQLSLMVSNFFENANITSNLTEKPQIAGSFVWNINDHALLHLKVAYELLVHHFGSSYLNDPVATPIRLCLKEQVVKSEVSFTNQIDVPGFKTLIDDKNHWVYIVRNFCVVSIFGSVSSTVFTDKNSEFFDPIGTIYKFDVEGGQYSKSSFYEYLNSLTNASRGTVNAWRFQSH